MKKISIAFILVLFVFVATALAGPTKATTVAEAKVSSVDTDVSLTGKVVKIINKNQILFSDGTGELLVHVANDITDKNYLLQAKINVVGAIVQDFMYTEVDAASITVLN